VTRLHRIVSTFISTASLGVLLCACPSAGVDKPPPDPLRADAATDAGPAFADAEVKDAEPAPDAEVVDSGFKLRSANLAPAAGSAGSPEHQLNGSFSGASAPGGGGAASDKHKLRGSLGPLSK
jgi:hypothetical protein